MFQPPYLWVFAPAIPTFKQDLSVLPEFTPPPLKDPLELLRAPPVNPSLKKEYVGRPEAWRTLRGALG